MGKPKKLEIDIKEIGTVGGSAASRLDKVESMIEELSNCITIQSQTLRMISKTNLELSSSIIALVERINILEDALFRTKTSFIPKDYN